MSAKGAGRGIVLVVSEDVAFSGAARGALEEAGYEVAVAGNGGAGLDAAERLRPVAAVVSFSLPDVSGAEVCRRLSAAGLPVVAVTEPGSAAQKVLSFESGARRAVSKPVDNKQLAAEVGRALDRLELSKQIHDYRESCGGHGDFGVFPSDPAKSAEECRREKEK